MDSVTSLWSRMNPSAALAAGLDVGVEAVLDLEASAPAIAAEARGLGDAGGLSAEELLVVKSAAAQADAVRPIQAVREALEWLRALVYLGRAGSAAARAADDALGAGLGRLARRCADGGGTDGVFVRPFVESIGALARDAGFSRIAASATDVDAALAPLPAGPAWEWIASAQAPRLVPPLDTATYERVLRDAYGVDEQLRALDARMERALAQEIEEVRSLSARVGAWLPGGPKLPEDVMRAIETERAPLADALATAREMAQRSTAEIREALIELGAEELAIEPQATPPAMRALITEGEEYLVGALTPDPRAYCFITEAKCGSVYTLANVLFHELAHCWNMLLSARRARDLPAALRVGGPLCVALVEGIATLREREVYELYLAAPDGTPYARLFDSVGVQRDKARLEFELDTRYWWLARLVRALFDYRVHGSRQDYVGFIREMTGRTGLSPERLHGFCFSFFDRPGCAQAYAFGTMRLVELRDALRENGMATRDFNTRVASIGMVPPALWRTRVQATPGVGG